MRRLILLRHAKSGWDDPRLPDRDRPLAPRGRRDAPLIGARIAEMGAAPAVVVSSPTVRTRETWSLIEPHLPGAQIRYENRLYEASAETILEVARSVPDEAATALILGHNPGLQDLAERLPAGGSPAALALLGRGFPTAAFALFEFTAESWRAVEAGGGRLEAFVIPRELDD